MITSVVLCLDPPSQFARLQAPILRTNPDQPAAVAPLRPPTVLTTLELGDTADLPVDFNIILGDASILHH